jgi:SAM-dependent methyltransferase
VSLLFVPSPVPFQPHAPSWRQPLYLHFEPLRAALEGVLPGLRGRVLDVGCGLQPYRSLLDSSVEYVGLDRDGPLSRPTVVGTAENIPFDADAFDAVLSTQVLEHVREPETALREAVRVLRRGGTIVLTVPGVWPAHEVPHDYWRFTRHGLLAMLERVGIASASVQPLGGLWSSVGQMINLELQRGPIARELVPLVNVAARWLDRRGAREDLALAWLATGVRAP